MTAASSRGGVVARSATGAPGARGGRGFARDERAVSDVLGSVLLVGVTVLLSGALAAFVIQLPGPTDRLRADVVLRLDPGAGGWGSGDEAVLLDHRGGEALPAADVTILLRSPAGAALLRGADLGSAFADGALVVGETWRHELLLQEGAAVNVDVTAHEPRPHLIALASLHAAPLAP